MSDPTTETSPIPALAAKLAEVRSLGRTLYPSKAGQREFRWNPPLDEATVRAFEERHATSLPDGYRQFLIEGGNGGIGPFGGVLPLERWNATATGTPIPDLDLARPSPLCSGIDRRGSIEECERLLGSPREAFLHGTITLTLQSYQSASLIVVGPERGRVVYLGQDENGVNHSPYFVRDPDFLSWYGRWLDELLAGFDDVWSGYGNQFGSGAPGLEADQVATLNRPDASAQERVDALFHLHRRRYSDLDSRNHSRFLALAPETLGTIRQHLDHDSPLVRGVALRVLLTMRPPGAESDVVRMARDPAPIVRATALVHLAGWHSDPPWDLIRGGLDDPDPEVIRAALYSLRRADRLGAEDVRRFLVHPDPKVRDVTLCHMAKLPPDPSNVGPLLLFLANPDVDVRREAVLELGRLGEPDAVPALLDRAVGEDDLGVIDAAIAALGMIGDPQAVPVLIGLADHADSLVRHGVAGALGTLGDPAAIPTLRALLGDEARPPRRNASEATGEPTPTSIADEARAALRALGEG